MFLARTIGWAGLSFSLLTTQMLIQAYPRSPAESGSNKEGVAAVHPSEIEKMQETLRNKGLYRGKIDGVFGLRTRASIRAYQKAENLPITGEVDTRTSEGLGVRAESNWGKSAGQEVGASSDRARGEIKRGKPSAGIRRADGRAGKMPRKEVLRGTAFDKEP